MQAPIPALKDALSQRFLTIKAKAQDQAQRGAELLTQVKAKAQLKANGVINAVASATAPGSVPHLPGEEVRRYQSNSLAARSNQMRRVASARSRRDSSMKLLEEVRAVQAASRQARSRSMSERRSFPDDIKSESEPTDTTAQKRSVANAEHFTIYVDRSSGTPLGIDVDFENGLQVQAVQEGNLIHAWNCHRPSRAVQSGDMIIEVNGMRTVDKMVAECQEMKLLRMTLSRSDTSTGSASSGTSRSSNSTGSASSGHSWAGVSDRGTIASQRPDPPAPSSVPQPTKFAMKVPDNDEEVVLFDASSAASDHEEYKSLPASELAGTSDPSEEVSEDCQPICDKASSSRGSLPESTFWEWPLSRSEKKLRVELIESNLWAMEHTELLKENEMLRRRRKSSGISNVPV